jgi:ribosomal protein S18 acetylase RimI-like enzyme
MPSSRSSNIRPPIYEDFAWRPLRAADASAMARLVTILGRQNGMSGLETAEDFAAYLADPLLDAAHNSLAAANSTGILALGWAMPDPDTSGQTRIDLWLDVNPAYRRRWLDRFLLRWLEIRARQICRERDAIGPAWMNIPSEWELTERIALIESAGFEPRHSEQTMRLALAHPQPEPALPAGIALLPWTPQRDDLMRRTFNAAFADRPGARVVSAESWRRYYTGGSSFIAQASFIALAGEEGVGLVRSLTGGQPGEGEIAHIAIRQDWRRRGLAGALLDAALQHFQARGLKTAMLRVSLENAPAIAFYEQRGFVVSGGYTSYRKDIAR